MTSSCPSSTSDCQKDAACRALNILSQSVAAISERHVESRNFTWCYLRHFDNCDFQDRVVTCEFVSVSGTSNHRTAAIRLRTAPVRVRFAAREAVFYFCKTLTV